LINRAVIEKGRDPVYLLANEDRAAS